jgi:hypothetical protein
LKLLAKDAEDRYQTARGLQADLEKLSERLARVEQAPELILGQQDITRELQLSQKLYARDDQRAALAGALERVRVGAREVLLVTGPAGVGKSILVREVFQPLTHGQGSFVQGKFEQYQRNVPQAPLIEALSQLVQRALPLPEAELGEHRRRLGQVLGANARLLCEVMPQLTLIVRGTTAGRGRAAPGRSAQPLSPHVPAVRACLCARGRAAGALLG